MAKIAHVINDNGNVYTRKPWTPALAAVQKYNGEEFFMDHERSPFFEKVLGDIDYIELTGHAFGMDETNSVTNWMIRFARHGLVAGGRQWKYLYGHYTDKGSMIMIPADARVGNLGDLGINIKDPNKAPKYMKRAKAPHQYSVFGEVLEVYSEPDGHIVEFQLEDGYIGTLRHVFLESLTPEQKAVADGQGRINPDFLRHIGVQARDLDVYSCKGTTLDPIGLGKGYYHAQKGLEFDVVVYGPKKQLTYDNFFFGILGSLKPGTYSYTDLQSMTNFDEWQFALQASQKHFADITDVLRNEEKLSAMFMARVNESRSAKVEADESFNGGWSIINAKRVGMSLHAEPSLIRKAAQHWTNEIMNCAKGRIPADHLMRRCDIVPDPHMFNKYGDVELEKTVIPNGHMVCFDVPVGPTVEYRQPNGHALEHSASMNIHDPRFKKYEGYQRCFYGADMLQMNAPKNGADNDDTQVVVFDPQMVNMIRGLNYPLTSKMEIREDSLRSRTGQYFARLTSMVENGIQFTAFGAEDFVRAAEAARGNNLRLGQVVNNIMLDTLLSGKHKLNMMKYLAERIQTESSQSLRILYLDHREWLANREDYQLRDVATNLEAVIDYCVQQKGDPKQFESLIRSVNNVKNNTKVYPFIYGKEGTGFLGMGRISPTKRMDNDFIFAPSLMCEALFQVDDERQIFMSDVRAFEFECISEVPEDLDYEFSSTPDMRKIAIEIRRDFNAAVSSAMNISNSKLRRNAYHDAVHGKFHKCGKDCVRGCTLAGELIQPGLKQAMEALMDDDERMMIAVELKRITQQNRTPLVDEKTGMIRGVPDAVFGNDVVFNIYLQALDKVGLTGKYEPVEFDQVSDKLRGQTFDVIVEQGIVLRKNDHFWIGTVDADNGEYCLKQGYLEVRKPSDEIANPHYYDIPDEEGNLRNPVDLSI